MKKTTALGNIHIDDLQLTGVDEVMYHDCTNNVYIVQFDEVFGESTNGNINIFELAKKKAYSDTKNSKIILNYNNIFIKYYDYDNEYLTALLTMKHCIDSTKTIYPVTQFMDDLNTYLVSTSMKRKVKTMVEEHFEINLTKSTERKLRMGEEPTVVTFIDEHGIIAMCIATVIRLALPLATHYYSKYHRELILSNHKRGEPSMTLNKFLYEIFYSFFAPFEQNEMNLLIKLTESANIYLNKSEKNGNSSQWTRARVKGITPATKKSNMLINSVINLMPKYGYRSNFVSLEHSSYKRGVERAIHAKDLYEYYTLNSTPKDTESLSGLDTVEAIYANRSDQDIIVSKANISTVMEKLRQRYNIRLSQDEIRWYKTHIRTLEFHGIIYEYFARDFGGIYDTFDLSKEEYIELLVMFYNIMDRKGFLYIQYLIGGNISNKVKKRKLSNALLASIAKTDRYHRIHEHYKLTYSKDKHNDIMKNLAQLINTDIELVDHRRPEFTGRIIKSDPNIVSDEYLRLREMIL